MTKHATLALTLALGLGGTGTPVAADPALDWPQFRGEARDGVSAATGLAKSWPAAGPKEVWRRPIGAGFSGMAVVGSRLYTMASEGGTEYALCLDAATGKELWRTAAGPEFREELGNGPRSTPTVDGDRVYVLAATGGLHALRETDGGKVWSVDLPKAFGSTVPNWGFSPSPLVDGDLLMLEVGGTEGRDLVALDKRTGKVKWSVRDGAQGYSSGIAVTIGGVRQYVFARRSGPEVVALSPTGEVRWAHPGPPTVIASPLFVPPDRIYVSAGDDAGAMLLRIKEEGGKAAVEEVWKNRSMKNHFNGSVRVGDDLYGFDNATLKCMAAATGEQRWAQRGLGKGSVVTADGLLFVLSDRGLLALVEATPEGYREKGRFQALTGKTWTAPAIAGRRLYVRDHDEIACFDLEPAPAAGEAAS